MPQAENKRTMTIELGDRYSGQAIKNAGKVIVGIPTMSYKPYDKEKVLDYLGDDWRSVVRPEFRVTGVKAVAESRGDDPNVIMESLFERVITNNSVTILPESKAPKYLQELDEGEVKELASKLGSLKTFSIDVEKQDWEIREIMEHTTGVNNNYGATQRKSRRD